MNLARPLGEVKASCINRRIERRCGHGVLLASTLGPR
jgi:hypothetical protein